MVATVHPYGRCAYPTADRQQQGTHITAIEPLSPLLSVRPVCSVSGNSKNETNNAVLKKNGVVRNKRQSAKRSKHACAKKVCLLGGASESQLHGTVERKEAEERQRAKAASKKVEAESRRRQAAETAQAQQQRTQTLRSAAFAAARAGDAKLVKKSIWEDSVDPAGGEVKMGCEKFIGKQPQDPKETLLHIATQKGDVELVEWLNDHSRSTQL